MIGDRVVIDLGDRAFLGAHAAGEIAKVIDGERQVGRHRLADRLAVVERLDHGEQLEVRLHLIGDFIQEHGALGGSRLAPRLADLVGGVEGELDILGGRAGDFAQRLAGHRREVGEVFAFHRWHPLPAYIVIVAGTNTDLLG